MRARHELEQLARGKAQVSGCEPVGQELSRSVTFARPPATFRLSWYGNEESLILEWSPDSEQLELGMWEDVALWQYPLARQSQERASQILRELNAEFQICLAQTAS